MCIKSCEVREETCLTRDSLAQNNRYLDWDSQPAMFKHYPHFCYRLKLSDIPSLQWLEQTRCISDKRLIAQAPYYGLNVPSAGNLHPLEIYVQLRNISGVLDRKSTRLNSSHIQKSRMPSSA